MADDLEARVRLLEAAEIVHDGRLNELEAWRRRDEPRVSRLVSAAEVAAEVRKALAERDLREWALWQKTLAVLAGLVTIAGGTVSFLNAIGVL